MEADNDMGVTIYQQKHAMSFHQCDKQQLQYWPWQMCAVVEERLESITTKEVLSSKNNSNNFFNNNIVKHNAGLLLILPELQVRGHIADNAKIIFLISQQKNML